MAKQMTKDEFLSLVLANQGIIYKVCNAYCRDIEKREDLAQDILVQLWRSYGTYNPQQKLTTWMYRVSLNVAVSFYRSEQRKKIEVVAIDLDKVDVAETRHEMGSRDENAKMLNRFIDELDELNKSLILLYLDDLSYKEISEVLGITETNVGTKIGRIKQKLKQAFSGALGCNFGD